LTLAPLAPHPFVCRDPSLLRHTRAGRFRLPQAPDPPRERGGTRTLGKMRRPDVCNQSSTRAPDELYDSRAVFEIARVEHRLTTTLQLRHDRARPSLDTSGGRGGEDARALLGPGGCCDRQPLRQRPSPAAFSATGRGCDVTSDALCHALRPDRADTRPPAPAATRDLAAETTTDTTHGPRPDGWDASARSASATSASTSVTYDEPGRLPSTSAPSALLSQDLDGGPPPRS